MGSRRQPTTSDTTLGQRIVRLEAISAIAPPAEGEPDVITFRLYDRPSSVHSIDERAQVLGTSSLLLDATDIGYVGTVSVTLPDAEDSAAAPADAICSASFEVEAPVSPAQMRTFPWVRVVAAARAVSTARRSNEIGDWLEAGRIAVRGTSDSLEPKPRPGRPPTSSDELRDIAIFYQRRQLAGSNSPTADVAREKHLSQSQAANLVSRARRAGYLPPTTRGKARS